MDYCDVLTSFVVSAL